MPAAPKATFIKGTQVANPMENYNIPVSQYQSPTYDINLPQEIQNAASGGAISPTFSKGTQVASLLDSFDIPIEQYVAATQNPNIGEEIQSAANGGLMQLAEGRSVFTQNLPMLQATRNRGEQASFGQAPHPVSFLSAGLGKANGGQIEGHNPEFYSEGGLNNRYVKGAGDGTSDDVPAMLANGEFVVPADVVSSLGNGSNDAGAHILDEFLKTIREHKRAADARHLPPDSKGALGYLLEAKKKVRS
jgi:hypothetical protein